MLAFRSEGDLDGWLAARGYDRGAIFDPQSLYDLGRDWYATRLDPDWEPATAAEATLVFARHGLTGPFWALSD